MITLISYTLPFCKFNIQKPSVSEVRLVNLLAISKMAGVSNLPIPICYMKRNCPFFSFFFSHSTKYELYGSAADKGNHFDAFFVKNYIRCIDNLKSLKNPGV